MKGDWRGEPLDNIERGDYLVICGLHQEIISDKFPYHVLEPKFSGHPFVVMEVSLPFVSVWDGERRSAFDLRDLKVRKVSRAYAMSLLGPAERSPFADPRYSRSPSRKIKGKKVRPKPQGTCPRCREGFMRRETFIDVGPINVRGWKKLCEECGWIEGTPLTNIPKV